MTDSVDSPLPPTVARSLGDRSYDKRKNAALEIEALIKVFQENKQTEQITAVIQVLSRTFSTSTNANHRKGGLIGIAATAIGLMQNTKLHLDSLLPPVLHCFDDPESRVRYYACESLYNIAKVARTSILKYFNSIFDGLCSLFADVDVDVKNGANLLDRLIKDIVTESETFDVETFIPLLQKYIRRTNPYIRQLLVGWIVVLDSVPDINMIDWLPDFLDGLFNMLSDGNREIRQAADSALSEFLREIKSSSVVEFGPMVGILVNQCNSKERLNRLTAITWVAEFINLGGDSLLPFYSDVLGAISHCIGDTEVEIRQVAEKTNDALLGLVKESPKVFELSPLLATLMGELGSDYVPTKMASLRWINMLLEKVPAEMNKCIEKLLPSLLKTLADDADAVVLLVLQVLSRISLAVGEFSRVLNALLKLFSTDRRLLEIRGSLVIRKLCVLLNAKVVYIQTAAVLSSASNEFSLEFISTMVQTLNLILLTAQELQALRDILKRSFKPNSAAEDKEVFGALFKCWCHNPVSTFSLCLLGQAYDLAFSLIKKFSEVDISVGLLMQLDKLIQLIESPVYIHLRLQLLEVEMPQHSSLLKALYGLLMLLPQSTAFRTLNARLTTVCNLRDNLNAPSNDRKELKEARKALVGTAIDHQVLLAEFERVCQVHLQHRQQVISMMSLQDEKKKQSGGETSG
ncbi:hypothetical protein TrST_g6121 [Triparma strigata]|uniref:Vacuolar protein 14 C-terminal Fig4-binding domain-containing protein n=1 Tax=Triparma strigata TaxID=1606541 RepID=A0A9W7CA41_9STRA|nr:hypothetical protein TrST_g6121 [Triparma strigata]